MFGNLSQKEPTWPHCKKCGRPMELLGFPEDWWHCIRCDKAEMPVDYSDKVAKLLKRNVPNRK